MSSSNTICPRCGGLLEQRQAVAKARSRYCLYCRNCALSAGVSMAHKTWLTYDQMRRTGFEQARHKLLLKWSESQ